MSHMTKSKFREVLGVLAFFLGTDKARDHAVRSWLRR